MFSLFKKKPKPREGLLEKFKLWDWWETNFTEDERNRIIEKYRPLGSGGPSPLIWGNTSASSPRAFLSTLATWFNNAEDFHLALKMMQKADTYPAASLSVEDAHFGCQERIKFFYRWRNDHAGALDAAIAACQEQVRLAPKAAEMFTTSERWGWMPRHYGYDQLAIIYEKQGKLKEAIDLCEAGKSQGWANDFDKRLTRLRKRLRKLEG